MLPLKMQIKVQQIDLFYFILFCQVYILPELLAWNNMLLVVLVSFKWLILSMLVGLLQHAVLVPVISYCNL